MGQAGAGSFSGGQLPQWDQPQAGAGASTTGALGMNPMPWATQSYTTGTPASETSTGTPLIVPEKAAPVNASAKELYVAPPAAAKTTVGSRNQVGPARFVNGTWTTFPSNHPDAPDYTGSNPGDWAAYGPQMYVPTGQKAQYSGTAKKAAPKKGKK